jgi:hypothetical protein
MPFVTPLALRYVRAGHYELTQDLVYRGAVDRFVVPAGTTTDLATIPRVVRWLLPQDGKWTRSSVFHDWACTVGIRDGLLTSRDVDGLYRRQCREDGTPLLARWLLWTGVRYGALAKRARRRGWLRDAPAVAALSALAAPLVVPASLVVLAALALYGLAEALVSLIAPTTGGAR